MTSTTWTCILAVYVCLVVGNYLLLRNVERKRFLTINRYDPWTNGKRFGVICKSLLGPIMTLLLALSAAGGALIKIPFWKGWARVGEWWNAKARW